ncbi:MAG: hypothetical protein ABI614_24310 [Planctomycetota bacterium]
MDQSNFMCDVPDPIRIQLWKLFQTAEAAGRHLNGNAIRVNLVTSGPAGWNRGRIEIPLNPSDMGVIHHEVGHAYFEGSLFHTSKGGGRNDWWGDAFCDAFRYCLEAQCSPSSNWMQQFPNEGAGGRYQYPASLIVKKMPTKDLDGLKSIWDDLLARVDGTDDFLDREFDYQMPRP